MKSTLNARAKLRRFGVRLGWRFGFRWYGLTARVGDRRDGDVVEIASTIEELSRRLAGGTRYVADGVDTMRHPRVVQRRIRLGEEIGDCDDHASYIASVLLKSNLAREVYLAQLHMQDPDGGVSGHAFVVFSANDDHDPNWYAMDYAMPLSAGAIRDVIEKMAASFAATPIAAAVKPVRLRADDGLRLLRGGEFYGWK